MRKIELARDDLGAKVLADGKPITIGWTKELIEDLGGVCNLDVGLEIASVMEEVMKQNTDLSDDERAEVMRQFLHLEKE
jgi:hypothetical protein